MNPFFMNNLNMGMGCLPFMMPNIGCGCGNFFMTMPYYQNDNLGFLNFPIYRDTSMDWLLDPNLALKQCQMKWQNGDFGPGSSFLPGFTFPSIGQIPGIPGMPGANPSQNTKTEEEKAKEKKKEEEAKKPDGQKAKALYDNFNKLKELAKDEKNNLDALDDELIQKAEEAMKKETAAEQLEAMKEVMESVPAELVRKTILADDKVSLELHKAGYNFNLKGNHYSFPCKYVKEKDFNTPERIGELIEDIDKQVFNEFMNYAAQFADPNGFGRNVILPIISAWNDSCAPKDKGLIRAVAAKLPEKNEGLLVQVESGVSKIAESLLNKASEYSNDSCPKLKALKDELRTNLQAMNEAIAARDTESNASKKADALQKVKDAMIKVADSFDKLYVRLRMQEALRIREDIKNNKEFKKINEVKPDVFDDNMIIEETIKDLKAEGFTNIPEVSDLDPLPKKTTITATNRAEDKNAEDEYESAQDRIDEYLVKERGALKKVNEDSNVYHTTVDIGDDGKFTRYFTVKDDKIVEATKNADGNFDVQNDAEEVSAEVIGKYHDALSKAKELIDAGKITYYNNELGAECKYPIFKSVVDNKYFIIKDNEFALIEDCTGIKIVDGEPYAEGTDKKLDELDSNKLDASSQPQSKLRTAEDKKKEDKKIAEKDITDVVAASAGKSLEEIKGIEFSDKYKIEPAAVNGYFKSTNGKNRFYVYNVRTKKLEVLSGVTEIKADGTMKRNGKIERCIEVGAAFDHGSSLAKNIYGGLNDDNITTAKRNLNTLFTYSSPENIVKFIEGYNEEKGWFEDSIATQIVDKKELSSKKVKIGNQTTTYGHYCLIMIAKQMLKVIRKTSGFTTSSEEYIKLQKIANGELLDKSYLAATQTGTVRTIKNVMETAEVLDEIINKVIKAYRAQKS